MSQFVRPRFNVDDDDIERLQEEFFAHETAPSAKVYRKTAPPKLEQSGEKKRSLFAERLAAASNEEEASTTMPSLESTMPTLENPEDDAHNSNDKIPVDDKDIVEYEPVMDPHPEPHVPVSKKMLDLTSMLGQVLGEITEKEIDTVSAPSLPNSRENVNKPAREHQNGFPKPVHRSEFKKRLEAKRLKNDKTRPRMDAPPQVKPQQQTTDTLLNNTSMLEDENTKRIEGMTEEELEEARQEIMNTLKPESIAILMKGLKNKKKSQVTFDLADEQQQDTLENDAVEQDTNREDDLLNIKEKYFADVVTEHDKLAWMDDRFLTEEMRRQEEERMKQLKEVHSENEASEAEKVYRKSRFDLQGRIVDPSAKIPTHTGLHHHGDDPDKAGYTLAELFYLTRSRVPAQRSMVLNTIARIIANTKKMLKESTLPVWRHVYTVLTGKEHAAIIYLRSALDDKNLIVQVSAIKALSALLLEEEPTWDETVAETIQFNQFLGHIRRPILKHGVKKLERKGLNEKLSELVDRVRQTSGQAANSKEEQKDDAALAERDLVRGLIQMDILIRMRYLLASDSSELVENDPVSVELLVRMLLCMAESGQDACEAIEEAELIEPIIDWGLLKTQWPMTDEKESLSYPSISVVRLLRTLSQGSKKIAEDIVGKATLLLPFLVTSPAIAGSDILKRRAYSLQFETLKLIRVLASYGFILPSLEDLQEPVIEWLRAVMASNECSKEETVRAATAIGLLEVLLHIAADPHKSIPAHAMEWHQPVAYLPAITAVLRARRKQDQPLVESALGYLSAWASYIELFPPETETVREVWKAVVEEGDFICHSTNHGLRYIQFITAYVALNGGKAELLYSDLIKEARERLMGVPVVDALQKYYSADIRGRYAFWLWLTYCDHHETVWKHNVALDKAELQCGVLGRQVGGKVEAWLSLEFLKLSFSKKELGDLQSFYLEQDEKVWTLSKALFTYDGRPIETFMYDIAGEKQGIIGDTSDCASTTVFILSPIDALYHMDKSPVAQQCRAEPATIVSKTLQLANQFFGITHIHREVAIVSLMKIFLIGDREGRNADMVTDREIFWDDNVSNSISEWQDHLCTSTTDVEALENAWKMSSDYIRQAQVPFYQFYQSFVAQYASVSFGHHGMARLLVYLLTQIKTVDYRHLVFSDYREVLPTLNNVNANELPQITVEDRKELEKAGLKLFNE